MRDLLKKLRNYEIQIRKAINSQMQGDFHSIFKGTGLEFDDVRPYQYGDDIRTIHWTVTAKGHGTFVKTFKEQKEQTIFFIVDVSASQDIGNPGKTKTDVGKEICGVLAISGAKEQSHIGLIAYSDEREIYLKPTKGMSQAYQIITQLVRLNPKSKKTSLNKAFSFALNTIKRRSVVIVISDFIDENYLTNFKSLARRHDVVAIQLHDNRETNLPKLGIIPTLDKESGKTIWVNTSFGDFRSEITSAHDQREHEVRNFCRKHQINYININTQEDYVPRLLKLFKVRNRIMKTN
jgi:uncharacterized protein (DUF58 family)